MSTLIIPSELVATYVANGWSLIHIGCCGQAHVAPPPVPADTQRKRLWRLA